MTEHVKIYGIIPKIQYVANGTQTTFSFPFAFFNTSDIQVYCNDTLQANDTYTVMGIRHSNGGTVTFEIAPTKDTVITIMRHLTIERTSDFQEGGALRADTLNDELDFQIACQQQLAENLNRSMVLPPYAVANDVNLTLPTPSAGKAIVWNANGTNLENSAVAVNEMESTLRTYKESAETAANTASQKADIASDKADVATEKAAEATAAATNKANKDMDNLSATGKTTITQMALPSDEYVDLTVGADGATYTAPANGYYFLAKRPSNGGSISLTTTLYSMRVYTSDTNIAKIILPVKKDTVVTLNYNGTNTQHAELKFIYAQGEI